MILIQPLQARNLLNNLDRICQHYGHASTHALLTAMVGDEASAARLEVILVSISHGTESIVTLPTVKYPPLLTDLEKLARAGVEVINQPQFKMMHYKVGTARMLRELGRVLKISEDSARCLLSRPEQLLYKSYMISPQWEVKRAEAVAADRNACRKCGRKGKLEVHHITYKRLGAELPEDLIAVCPACHAALDAATGFGKGRREARRG